MEGSQYIAHFMEALFDSKNSSIILIFEYADGETLEKFIERASRKEIQLTSEMLTTIAFNLFSAINFVH